MWYKCLNVFCQHLKFREKVVFGLIALQCTPWAPWSLLTIKIGPISNKTLKKRKKGRNHRVNSAVLHTLRTRASHWAQGSAAPAVGQWCLHPPAHRYLTALRSCRRVLIPRLPFSVRCTQRCHSGLLKRETFIHLKASSTSSLPYRNRKMLPKHPAVSLSHLGTMLSGTSFLHSWLQQQLW